mgnify:CR=1 FL=1
MIEATYIDHMGTDLTVANAARVSFGKSSEMEENTWGPPSLKAKDAKLISYLAKHKHISPFGHCFASFHVKAPVYGVGVVRTRSKALLIQLLIHYILWS